MLLNSLITLLGKKKFNLDLWQGFLPSLASSLLQSKVSRVNSAQGTVHHAFDVFSSAPAISARNALAIKTHIYFLPHVR